MREPLLPTHVDSITTRTVSYAIVGYGDVGVARSRSGRDGRRTRETVGNRRTGRAAGAARGRRGGASLFATPLRPSHYLELVNPLWTTHTLQARVESVWDETRGRAHADAAARARLARASRRPVRPRRRRRSTACATPAPTRSRRRRSRGDGCITITVKAIAGGRVSPLPGARRSSRARICRSACRRATSCCPDATPVRPLFITAGSGITPVMSMLRTLARRGAMPDVVHVHYAPHAHDVIFAQRARAARGDAPALSAAPASTRAHAGGAESPALHAARSSSTLCPGLARARGLGVRPAGLLDALEAHWDARRPRRARCTSSASTPRWRDCRPTPPAGRSASRAAAATSTADGAHAPAARRRGRGPQPRPRLPHGHLPHLRRHACIVGLRARSAHRRAARRARPAGADLRLRRRRRRRAGAVMPRSNRRKEHRP